MSIIIDTDICTGCKRCIPACPYDALAMEGKKAVRTPACTGCGACLDACKYSAISLAGGQGRIKMDITGFSGIYVFIETLGGAISEGSLEILGKARELADSDAASRKTSRVTAVLPGHALDRMPEELIALGADHVIIIDDPRLAVYRTDYYTRVITDVIREKMPEIILFGATPLGRDLAPRIANRIKTGLTADCTGLSLCSKDGILLQTRPAFGGNIMATIVCPDNRPQMATVRPGVMRRAKRDSNRIGTTETMALTLGKKDDLIRHVEVVENTKDAIDFEDARIIIAGGRGIKGPEGFELLGKLAAALGARIGATRAAVEAGWISRAHQIGQTGKTVRPDLYIACGVSGSIQHMAGVMGAGRIIAVNSDRNAPICEMADETYVGDLFSILPELTREITERKTTAA
ncbi:MAG TPA: electron transfer flavoprotein subunit alpha [Desulfobacteraceae bacterium]|nr:electron transfer flavoprotein subunit alpha [Desulfobacteraceae bacterium]